MLTYRKYDILSLSKTNQKLTSQNNINIMTFYIRSLRYNLYIRSDETDIRVNI